MPPLGGIIHLGLILKDGAFSTTSFEKLQAVVDVKAKGILILHKELAQEQLEFLSSPQVSRMLSATLDKQTTIAATPLW